MPAPIIEDARTELHPDDVRAESILSEIHRRRRRSRKGGAADRAKFEAEKIRGELTLRLDRIEDERRAIFKKARAEAEAQIQALGPRRSERHPPRTGARPPAAGSDAGGRGKGRSAARNRRKTNRTAPHAHAGRPLPAAQRSIRRQGVFLKSLNAKGVVTALGEEEAEVQVGMLRIRARLFDLELFGPGYNSRAAPGPRPSYPG